MENENDHVTRCPRCFGRDVRPSQHKGIFDAVMKAFRRSPFRCRNCKNRFYRYIPPVKDDLDETVDAGVTEPKQEAAHKPDMG